MPPRALLGQALSSARAIRSLAESTATLAEAVPRAAIEAACARGYFRPLEEEALLTWFARLLSMRDALWTVIAEVVEAGGGRRRVLLQRLDDGEQRRLFLVGYAAACLLVRLDRLLVEDVAAHRLTQRKLNEGSVRLRIPRKQYTAVFESMALPRNAILLPGYRDHALRRRGASANQQAAFGLLESSGRLVAELRDHWGAKRVTGEVRDALDARRSRPRTWFGSRSPAIASTPWPSSARPVARTGSWWVTRRTRRWLQAWRSILHQIASGASRGQLLREAVRRTSRRHDCAVRRLLLCSSAAGSRSQSSIPGGGSPAEWPPTPILPHLKKRAPWSRACRIYRDC